MQFTDDESQKITAHSWCFLKCRRERIVIFFFAFYGHISQNRYSCLGDQCQIVFSFGGRFINARENFAGVMRFKLSGKKLFFNAVVSEVARIQAVHCVGDGSGKNDVNCVISVFKVRLG